MLSADHDGGKVTPTVQIPSRFLQHRFRIGREAQTKDNANAATLATIDTRRKRGIVAITNLAAIMNSTSQLHRI